MSTKSVIDRYIPAWLAWRAVDPLLTWVCSKSSDGSETYVYHGEGQVEYIGDRDERELGVYQATAGMLPPLFALVPVIATLSFLPDGLYQLPIHLVLGSYILLALRVMDNVEIHRQGGEKA